MLAPNTLSQIKERILLSTLASRFALGAFWSLISAIISRGLTLLASILIARILGQTGYGELGMIQSTVGTIGVFAGLGLGMTSTRYVADYRFTDPAKAGRVLALLSLTSLLTASAVAILLMLGASVLAVRTLNAPHLSLPIGIGAGLVFFGVLNGVQTGALAGFEAFRTIARVNLLVGLISFPLVIVCTWIWGISGAVVGLVLSLAANWLLNNYALRKECANVGISYEYTNSLEERALLWKFTLPAALSSFLVAPITWFSNILLIRQTNGYAEMGIFSAGQLWQSAILFLPTSLAPLVLATLSSTHHDNNDQNYWRMVKLSFVINGIIAGGIALFVSLFSRTIMSFYGPTFSNGWMVLTLLAITAFLIAEINVIGQVIASSASMWWGFLMNFLWAIAFVGFSLLWIKPYGAVGLANAYIASYLCHLGWTSFYLFRRNKQRG